jgi:protein TonB
MKAVITENGTLQNIQLVDGPAVLASAGVDVLRRWRYTPYLQNGKPRAIETRISMKFKPSFTPHA